MNRLLIVSGVLVALIALALVAEISLPHRPTRAEAIGAVLAREGQMLALPLSDGEISTIQQQNVTIVATIDRVPRTMLVAYHYEDVAGGAVTKRCAALDYVTRRRFDGRRTHSLGQTICPSSFRLINFEDDRERGTYALLGMVTDERITSIRGTWSDGYVGRAPIRDGVFLFFREDDDLKIEWVVGVDAEGRELAETRRDNN